MAENIPLSFLVGMDIAELKAKAKEGGEVFAELGKRAEKEGAYIDALFNHLGKNFDVSTIEGKMNALRQAISDNNIAILGMQDRISSYEKDANEAFARGDFDLFKAINRDIVDDTKAMKDLESETTYLSDLLKQMNASVGNASQQNVQAPRLFIREKDYENVQKMEEKLVALKRELADADDAKAFSKTNDKIIKLQYEIDQANQKAEDAANALGGKLGASAAEATTKLYQLNEAVKKQEKEYEELGKAVDNCLKELEKLQAVPEKKKDYEAIKAKQLEYQELSESYANAGRSLSNLTAEQADASKEASKYNGVMTQLLGGTDNYSKIMSNLPGPIKNVVSGFKGMVTAAKAFIATPIGAVIGALVLALGAIKKALNSSVEGQNAMARASGALKGVLVVLNKVVITIGNALIKAFKEPKKVWDSLVTTIKSGASFLGKVYSELGQIIKNALTFNFDEMKEHAKNLGNLFGDVFDTVEDIGGKLIEKGKGFVKDSQETIKRMADIEERRKKLDLQESNFEARLPLLQKKESELMAIMRDTTKTSEERSKAMVEYEKVVKQIYGAQIGFAQQRLKLYNEEWKGRTKNNDVLIEENELRKKINELSAQQQSSITSLQRVKNGIANASKKELSKEEREARLLAKLQMGREQNSINIMQEGLEKKLRQIDLNYRKEMEVIKENELNMKKNSESGELNEEQKQELVLAAETAEAVMKKAKDDALKEALSSYLSYEQSRLKIAEEYENKINALYERDENGEIKVDDNGNKVLREGVTQDNIENIRTEQKETEESIAKTFAEKDEVFLAWSKSVTDMTLSELQSLLVKARKELETAKSLGASDQDIARATAMVNQLEGQINSINANEKVSPGANERKEWELLRSSIDDVADSIGDIGDEIDGVAGEILSLASDVTKGVTSMISNIQKLGELATSSTKGIAQGMAKAIQTAEKASVILAIISTAIELQGKINDIVSKYDNEADTYEREALEKRREAGFDHEYNLERLKKNYDALGEAINKAYGSNKSRLIKEQEENLRKQQEELLAARKEEEDNKHSDNDAIADYDKKIEENRKQLEALKQAEVDAIFGEDIQGAVESLADALIEAWKNGEDGVSAMNAEIDRIVENMIAAEIKSAILESDIIKRLRSMIRDTIDGKMGFSKIFNTTIRDFRKGMEDLNVATQSSLASRLDVVKNIMEQSIAEMNEQYREWIDYLGELGGSGRTAANTGIAQASQDSVDELNGRMTAVQGHTFSIKENTQLLLDCSQDILKNVSEMNGKFDTLNEKVGKLKEKMDDIDTNGIKLRM